MAIILGIDPGSRITGYGIIRFTKQQYQCLACGTIQAKADTLSERLHKIYEGLSNLITTYQPSEAGIEKVFVHRNVDSAIKLGQARGAAIVACASMALEVAEYSPRSIKQAIVGTGAADKAQVQHMVKRLLNLSETPSNDAADALAIAVCHAHNQHSLYQQRLREEHL